MICGISYATIHHMTQTWVPYQNIPVVKTNLNTRGPRKSSKIIYWDKFFPNSDVCVKILQGWKPFDSSYVECCLEIVPIYRLYMNGFLRLGLQDIINHLFVKYECTTGGEWNIRQGFHIHKLFCRILHIICTVFIDSVWQSYHWYAWPLRYIQNAYVMYFVCASFPSIRHF